MNNTTISIDPTTYNHNDNDGSRSIYNPTTSGSQACAACKYQRRKCTNNCLLAPFFPPHHQKDFLNAHKFFGIKNLTRVIKELHHNDQKLIAMKSLIFQANVRAKDPVGGCYRLVCDLQRQIDYYKAELELALHLLSICRSQIELHNNADPLNADLLNFYDAMPHNQSLSRHSNFIQHHHSSSLEEDDCKINQSGSGKVNGIADGGGFVKGEMEGSSSSSLTGYAYAKQTFEYTMEDVKSLVGVFDKDSVSISRGLVQSSDVVVKEALNSVIEKEEKENNDRKDASSYYPLTNGKT